MIGRMLASLSFSLLRAFIYEVCSCTRNLQARGLLLAEQKSDALLSLLD